ncbi:MAG: DUF4093 domain-containing protein [Clostridia bacterium]|nr:DUF4093 domain-containing protein [Clostridia bacterium]
MEKIKVSRAILVEGKYDKILLERFIDGHIFTTGGFSVFSSDEKAALFRKIAEKHGIIILTDSDPAGFVIRNKLKGMLPKDKVTNIYAPALYGKEKRKSKPSKAGILGVEGIDIDTLRELFERCGVVDDGEEIDTERHVYTKAQLYEYGLCGRPDSSALRDALCERIGLPKGMTPNALLEAINILGVDLENC